MGTPAVATEQGPDTAIRAEILELVRRIGKARDLDAVDRLRVLARDHPQLVACTIKVDLPRRTREFFVEQLLDRKDMDGERDALIARMELMIKNLAGDDPSEEVRLLAEAAAYEWASHWVLCMTMSTKEALRVEHPGLTKRRTASAKRFTAGLKALAQVKRLQRPILVAAAIHVNGKARDR
jgi:hypothetical protein